MQFVYSTENPQFVIIINIKVEVYYSNIQAWLARTHLKCMNNQPAGKNKTRSTMSDKCRLIS